MKRLRSVLGRLPSLFDRGAFALACREIRRVVPIDQLGIARFSDDGTHLRIYRMWTSPDVGIPQVQWSVRVPVTRERLARAYPNGRIRLVRNTLESPQPYERAFGEAGILCTLSVPIGKPPVGIVGFGFTSADRLTEQHRPLLKRIAVMLLDRLDSSLLRAHAARLQKVIAAMPMGAIMLARDGTVEEVNPAAERLLGRGSAELAGCTIRELVTAPDGGPLGWRIDRAAGPAPALAHTPSGARPVELQLAAPPQRDCDTFLYGPLFIVDSSAQALLAARTEELHALARDHQKLVDSLPVIVFSYDAQSRCTYVNRAVERILGYTPDEIYAIRDWSSITTDGTTAGPPVPGEVVRDVRQRRKDGREIVMRYKFVRVADAEGRMVRTDGFGVDVTAERDAQTQLMLADRLAALGMLVAGIGHEINNPAAYVGLGVQQIARQLRAARQLPDGEVRAALERALPILDDVAAGVHRIAEIVGELRQFSRNPDSDAPGPIDLNGLVRSAAALVQAELRSRARLALELDELPPAPGSWSRLSQVVLNLLINAAQAIAPGASDGNEVRVATRRDGDEVRIVVSDSGCGIPEATQRRIFDPFFTTKPPGEGTGLGLAISYDIVRRLGGAISVESEPGRGSRFTVTLPVRRAVAVAPPPRADAVEPSGSVLVVDDERPLAAAIARELGARMQVELAHSGGEALRALERGRFDAVLCDLRMPDLSGAELYRTTARRDRGQAARFVFITGAAGAADEAEFLRASGRPVLEKPFGMAELWRTVGAVVAAAT